MKLQLQLVTMQDLLVIKKVVQLQLAIKQGIVLKDKTLLQSVITLVKVVRRHIVLF